MSKNNLAELIGKEKETLVKLKEKREEIDAKIKKSEEKLRTLEMTQNSERFSSLSGVMKSSGLSVEDLMQAVLSGDLLSLQEKMEAAQQERMQGDNVE